MEKQSLVYSYSGILLGKKIKLPTHRAMINLRNIVLNKGSQTQNSICVVWFQLCEILDQAKLICSVEIISVGEGMGIIGGQGMREFLASDRNVV